MVPTLQWFSLGFSDFMVVQKWSTFDKNHTLKFALSWNEGAQWDPFSVMGAAVSPCSQAAPWSCSDQPVQPASRDMVTVSSPCSQRPETRRLWAGRAASVQRHSDCEQAVQPPSRDAATVSRQYSQRPETPWLWAARAVALDTQHCVSFSAQQSVTDMRQSALTVKQTVC